MKKALTLSIFVSLLAALIAGSGIAQPLSIVAKVSPGTIVIGSDVTWVSVHTDISLARVNTSTLTLNGVPIAWTKADSRGNLVAKFNFDKIERIVTPPGEVLTLKGVTKDGILFAGSDRVVVRKGGPKK